MLPDVDEFYIVWQIILTPFPRTANTRAMVVLPIKTLATVKLDGTSLLARGIVAANDGSFVLPAGAYLMTWRR